MKPWETRAFLYYNNSMKKKIILSVILLLLPFFVTVVHADIGPKPSIDLTVEGLGEGEYYLSIFGDDSVSGPNRPYESGNGNLVVDLSKFPEDIVKTFIDYKSGEYCFWGYIDKVTKEDNTVRWGYYAPDKFMIVIITPDGKLIASEPQQKGKLADYYICTVKDGTIELSDNYDYGKEILRMMIRVVFTIIIELGIGLLFRFTAKEEVLLIVKTNIFTQLFLNIALTFTNILGGIFGALLIMFPLEFLIFMIEGFIYSRKMEGKAWPKWIYSLVANAVSFYAGAMLLGLLSSL